MKIELRRRNDAVHLEATNEEGSSIQIDGAPDIGGSGNGMRPMQILLSALGGCSTIDVISLLKKQRQVLQDIQVTVSGEREKNAVPSLFTNVHVHFKLYGTLDRDKAEKAVSLSIEKYCSVARTMQSTRITYDVEIIEA